MEYSEKKYVQLCTVIIIHFRNLAFLYNINNESKMKLLELI